MAKYDRHMLTTASVQATEHFLDNYYVALSSSRHTIASYFCPTMTTSDGFVFPHIVWNGNVYSTPADYQQMYEQCMPYTYYEVQSFDCQILNPTSMAPDKLKGGSGLPDKDIERRMSIIVVVSGTIRLEEPKTGPMRQFSETFVLVPNPEKQPGHGKMAEKKGWLVQNQNFRYVV